MAVRNVTRADAASVAALAKFGVATVHEAMGRVGLLDTYMRPIYPGAKACGTAVTILAHPGDNWMLHVAAEMLRPGDVAVLGTSSANTDGMFGDLLATPFRARGAVGLVIDAGSRDTAELREMGFPVWSNTVNAKGTVKATVGSVNTPILCAGAFVHPGDVVVADDDGVVIVPEDACSCEGGRRRRRGAKPGDRRERANVWGPANWGSTWRDGMSRPSCQGRPQIFRRRGGDGSGKRRNEVLPPSIR